MSKQLIDARLALAEQIIHREHGHKVSVSLAAEGFFIGGRNPDLGTSIETVWNVGGDETYVSDNLIDTISSSDAGDTQTCYIEGMTVSGGIFTRVTQTATLNGQNKVVLTTPLARVNRFRNTGSTDNTGDWYIYQDTAIVAGVPTDITKVHSKADAGANNHAKTAYTFASNQYFIVTHATFGAERQNIREVDFFSEERLAGSVFINRIEATASSPGSTNELNLDPPYILRPNSDFRLRAISSGTSTAAYGCIHGYIAQIVNP